MYELDKRVQDVIDKINDAQANLTQGMEMVFEGCKKKLSLNSTVTLIELKKYKKEFINLCKQYPPNNVEDIGDAFITYLNTNLNR